MDSSSPDVDLPNGQEPIRINLTPEQAAMIDQVAAEWGVTPAEAVRRILDDAAQQIIEGTFDLGDEEGSGDDTTNP